MDSLIGHLHMQGIAVSIGINGNGFDAHLLSRLDYPACYLTAICDQDFVKHMQTLWWFVSLL